MNYNNIGKNIKFIREKSNISQKDLAAFLKIDQSLISRIEKNERQVTTDLLDSISCLFGIPCETFFSDDFNEAPLAFSFRTKEITIQDFDTLSLINKIALNLKFMNNISKDYH
ncbi:MAG: helix-turn-helix domain-containing protein [Pleomorphochaeta sp.]